MISRLFFYILFCAASLCYAQNSTVFTGKVVTGQAGVKDVFVINKKTGVEVKTDQNGSFSIDAKSGDVLVVYNTRIQERQFTLSDALFKTMPFIIQVNPQANEMEELVINKYGRVDEVSLELVPANQKRYTVAGRRLNFAMGGGVPIIYLINLLNGQIALAKRAVRTEKKVTMIENLQGMYNEDEITELFGIPKENVNGFLYYLSEDKEFALIVKQGRKPYLDFLMLDHAKNYTNLLKDGE